MKRLLPLFAVLGFAVVAAAFTAAANATWPTTAVVKLALLQFYGATGVPFLRVPDNVATALTVEDFENGGDLLTVTTTNSSENITVAARYLHDSSLTAGATAATGNQGTGAMTVTAEQVTTVGSANDDITLPPTAAGRIVVACNAAASNALDVWPASGSQINKETTNTQITLAAGECMVCFGFSTTRWGCTIGSAN